VTTQQKLSNSAAICHGSDVLRTPDDKLAGWQKEPLLSAAANEMCHDFV
jgi:hypothetical protein